jgi:hypothetical protein
VRPVTNRIDFKSEPLIGGMGRCSQTPAITAQALPAFLRFAVAPSPTLRSGRFLRSLPASAAFFRQRSGFTVQGVDHPLLIVPRSARQREVASGFLDLTASAARLDFVAPLIARTAAVGVVAFVGRMDLSNRGQVQSWGDAFAQRILPVRQSV